MNNSVTIFYSYAHEDDGLRKELETHLSDAASRALISGWHDRKILAGTEWNSEIKSELDSADIILFLLSPEFLASTYCDEIEIPQAMARAEARDAVVIPVILRACNFRRSVFAKLQSCPRDAVPVTSQTNRDQAFEQVAEEVRTVAALLLEKRGKKRLQKEADRATYLKKAAEVSSDGEILVGGRDTLDELRRELKLTPAEAAALEEQASSPFKAYRDNLQKYRGTLEKWVEQQYPLSEKALEDLKLRKRDLGLRDEDVEKVEFAIKSQADARYRNQQAGTAPTAARAVSPVLPSALPPVLPRGLPNLEAPQPRPAVPPQSPKVEPAAAPETGGPAKPVLKPGFWARWFLLYRPANAGGWVLRVLFVINLLPVFADQSAATLLMFIIALVIRYICVRFSL